MSDLTVLTSLFSIPNKVWFEERGELILLVVKTTKGKAVISLQGAHLTKWIPAGHKPVIWLSEDAEFKTGKSIRGGIPICWPWFGAHPDQSDLPAHGFARSQNWTLQSVDLNEEEDATITFEFDGAADYWPFNTPLSLCFVISDRLSMSLTTRNKSEQAITIGSALHTYFEISSVDQISIQGLENRPFIDTLDGNKRKTETTPITIDAEIDRIYLDEEDTCVIVDQSWQREIKIEKSGSHSTVVWNPWVAKSERMGDMGSAGYTHMVCVETANAANDVITLGPGAEHTLGVTYSVFTLTT